MQSIIILLVGASGVGKDSLLNKTKEVFPKINFIRRYITRKADTHEDNFSLSKEEFESLKAKDFFISTWEAHDNLYAIAKKDIQKGINFISVSRGAIRDFESLYDNVYTIHVRVSKKELESRLKKRGRENLKQIQKRLARSYKNIQAKNLIEFDNSLPMEQGVSGFIALIGQIIYKKENAC